MMQWFAGPMYGYMGFWGSLIPFTLWVLLVVLIVWIIKQILKK